MTKTFRRLLMLSAMLIAQLPSAQAADTEINFVTDFGFNGRHSYFYVALDKGYYAAEGLDVHILRGQGSADAIKKVASGAASFAFADAGALVLARGNDAVPVKMVSVVYARPPQGIFVLADSGIALPQDLEGKTLADTAASSVRLLFPAYAEAAGIDASKVKWVTSDGAALSSLLATKRVDGIGQFVVGQPLVEQSAAPSAVRVLRYSDAGLDFYGNGIVASEDTIADQPELVRAFVRATHKGMRDAFADPAEAATIMHKYQKQIDPAIIEGETRLVKELASTEGVPMGVMEPVKMQQTVDIISRYFDLKRAVSPTDVFVTGFVQ